MLNIVDNGFSFPGSRDGWLEDCPGPESTFVASPVQFSGALPDVKPSFLSPQPTSSMYPPSRDEYHSANFVATSPTPNAHTPPDVVGWHPPTDPHSIQHYAPFFNPQYSEPTSTIMPTTHQPPATLGMGSASIHNGLQGYSYAVMPNGSSFIHDASYSPSNHVSPSRSTVPFQYSGSPTFVDETQSYNSAMGMRYQEIQPKFAGVTPSSSIPSDLAFQPIVPPPPLEKTSRRNSRADRSITSSPYHPIRRFSLPVQAVSPKETVLHTCRWIMDDGTMCTAQITWARVPEHLTTHGVTNMAHNYRVACGWSGCRMRGDKGMMNRESIVRHVREKHLGYRRTL